MFQLKNTNHYSNISSKRDIYSVTMIFMNI